MIITGYCEKCHRVKQVRVSNMGRFIAKRVPIGICRDCEDKKR